MSYRRVVVAVLWNLPMLSVAHQTPVSRCTVLEEGAGARRRVTLKVAVVLDPPLVQILDQLLESPRDKHAEQCQHPARGR